MVIHALDSDATEAREYSTIPGNYTNFVSGGFAFGANGGVVSNRDFSSVVAGPSRSNSLSGDIPINNSYINPTTSGSDATQAASDSIEEFAADTAVDALTAADGFTLPLLPAMMLMQGLGQATTAAVTGSSQDAAHAANFQNLTSHALGANYLSTYNNSVNETNIATNASMMNAFSVFGPLNYLASSDTPLSNATPNDTGYVYNQIDVGTN